MEEDGFAALLEIMRMRMVSSGCAATTAPTPPAVPARMSLANWGRMLTRVREAGGRLATPVLTWEDLSYVSCAARSVCTLAVLGMRGATTDAAMLNQMWAPCTRSSCRD